MRRVRANPTSDPRRRAARPDPRADTPELPEIDPQAFAHLEEDEGDKARALSNAVVGGYIARQWRRRPLLFSGMAIFTLVGVAGDIAAPIAAGRLVDALGAEADVRGPAQAWAALWVFLGCMAVAFAGRQLTARCEIHFSSLNMRDLAAESFQSVQRFSADWHANTFAGSTVRKISRGMWAYDMVTATLFFGSIPTTLILIGLPIYMLIVYPPAGVFACVVVIVFMLAVVIASNTYIRPANRISNARDSAIGGALADAIGSNAVVKSFGAEAREDARFALVMHRWQTATRRTWGRYVTMGLVTSVASLILSAGMIGILIHLWSRDAASTGDVVTVVAAFLTMAGYLRRFGEEVQNIRRGMDELEDLAAFERAEPEVRDAADAADFAPGAGVVTFDGVEFGYANQAAPLYQDFSLSIAAGETVALVGQTGSGKSTFVKLLQRLYDVQGGRILVDDQDIAQVRQASLRRAIALVPQDPALFHRSIAENIAYARPDADRDAIETAARRARAHDFIARLPQGYDTLVGERGVKLSGGERQRVAVARALLADAPILVLDEATSSLDNATEQEVQLAMDEVMKGRTTIVIAHRLSTIRDADRILVFDQGRVVEQGRHDALLAQGGIYARLHDLAERAA